MTDATPSFIPAARDLVLNVFDTLDSYYGEARGLDEKLGQVTEDRSKKRKELMDNAAAVADKNKWTTKDIDAAITRAIRDYKGNGITEKTLQNIGGELKNVMNPSVRAGLPALRKLAEQIFDKQDKNSQTARDTYKRADFMVAQIATAAKKGNAKMPTTLADVEKLASTKVTAKAESVPDAKRAFKNIRATVAAEFAVFKHPLMQKMIECCDKMLEEDVLKDALAEAQAAAKNAQNLRRTSQRRNAQPTQGASDIVADMNDAIA